MGFASCYEDNLDARGESLRRFSHQQMEKEPTVSKSKKSRQTKFMESQFKLRRSADSTRVNRVPHRKEKSQRIQRKISRQTQPKRSLKPLQQKETHNIRQDICRRELQKTQRARVQKTPHVPVMKTQYVTTEEIARRVEREIIRQSGLKE